MNLANKKVANFFSIIYRVIIVASILGFLLLQSFYAGVIMVVGIIILSFLCLPNFILLKRNSLFGLLGSISCLVFLFFYWSLVLFFSKAAPLRFGAVFSDTIFFFGLIGYILLALNKKAWFKIVEKFALILIPLLIIVDTIFVLKFSTNIAVFVIERLVPFFLN